MKWCAISTGWPNSCMDSAASSRCRRPESGSMRRRCAPCVPIWSSSNRERGARVAGSRRTSVFDILIRGDRVATVHGVGAWDVAIEGGRIVAVAAPGTFSERDAGRVIDARGKLVIPGGIDPHIHCKFPQPMGTTSAPPDHVSRAALFGGTTTLLDFAVWERGETLQQTLERRDADCWRGQCHCDYGFHVLLTGDIPPELIGEVPEVIQAGFPSIKMFTTEVRPE